MPDLLRYGAWNNRYRVAGIGAGQMNAVRSLLFFATRFDPGEWYECFQGARGYRMLHVLLKQHWH